MRGFTPSCRMPSSSRFSISIRDVRLKLRPHRRLGPWTPSMNATVETIDAVGVPVLSRGEDIANARLRFASGCIANITSSRISPERMRKIRVFQEDAYLSLDYQGQSGEIYRRVDGQITREPVPIDKEEPLRQQLASFVDCALTGGEPKVSGSHAAAALELAVEITKRIATT